MGGGLLSQGPAPGHCTSLPPSASQTGPSPTEPSAACHLCAATQLETGRRGYDPALPIHAGLRGRTAFGARGRPSHSTPAAPRDVPDSPDGLAPVAPQRPPDGLHVRLELGQAGLLEESAVVGVLAGGGQAELGHCNESPRTGHPLGSPAQPAHPCGVRGWLHPPRPTPISTEWPI